MKPDVLERADDLFTWTAHFVEENGFRFVVVMNNSTNFLVVLNGAKMTRLKNFESEFKMLLRLNLLEIGVSSKVIDEYLTKLGSIEFGKNSNRSKTAQMNKLVLYVWHTLNVERSETAISWSINRMMKGNEMNVKDYRTVNEVMIDALVEQTSLQVRNIVALDLHVRLYLDGKDAVRHLRVPGHMTFERFHKALQAVFNWKNAHLYSFSIFKEWDSNPYAYGDVELVKNEFELAFNPEAELMAGKRLSDFLPTFDKMI